MLITDGATADCTQAAQGIDAERLLADRAYDTDESWIQAILVYCRENNIYVVIPSKRNRKIQDIKTTRSKNLKKYS